MIDILGDRFIGMYKEHTENGFVLRLEVDFKSVTPALRWTVFNKMGDDGDIIFVTQKVYQNGNIPNNFIDIYHVIGMEGVITFEDLIKHSKQIIDFNTEVEEKKILLNEKFEELGELFTKHSIDKLRTLQFVFPIGDSRIYPKEIFEKEVEKPQPKTRKPRKRKEKAVEDVVLELKEEEVIEIREVTVEEITEKVTAKAEERNLTEDEIKDLNDFRKKLNEINEKNNKIKEE